MSDNSSRWIAKIMIDGKERFLGQYESKVEAEQALALKLLSSSKLGSDQEVSRDQEHEDTEVVVREALRSMTNYVERLLSRPDPPSHFLRPSGAVRLCRFGELCQRTDSVHWY